MNVWMTDTQKKQLEQKAADLGFPSLTEFLQAVANGTVKVSLKIALLCCLIAKLTQSPTSWSSAEVYAEAVGTGLTWFGTGAAYVLSGLFEVGSTILASL